MTLAPKYPKIWIERHLEGPEVGLKRVTFDGTQKVQKRHNYCYTSHDLCAVVAYTALSCEESCEFGSEM